MYRHLSISLWILEATSHQMLARNDQKQVVKPTNGEGSVTRVVNPNFLTTCDNLIRAWRTFYNKTANISNALGRFEAADIQRIDPNKFKDSFETAS